MRIIEAFCPRLGGGGCRVPSWSSAVPGSAVPGSVVPGCTEIWCPVEVSVDQQRMKITIVDGSSGIAELQLGIGARRAAQIRNSEFEFFGAGEAIMGVEVGCPRLCCGGCRMPSWRSAVPGSVVPGSAVPRSAAPPSAVPGCTKSKN